MVWTVAEGSRTQKWKRALLTKDQVRAIRKKLSENAGLRALSDEFGVSPHTIKDIKQGKTWKGVV